MVDFHFLWQGRSQKRGVGGLTPHQLTKKERKEKRRKINEKGLFITALL